MNWLALVRQFLNGKKTHIGGFLLSVLGAMYSLDCLIDPDVYWIDPGLYAGLGVVIGGATGVSMRLAVSKAASWQNVIAALAQMDLKAQLAQQEREARQGGQSSQPPEQSNLRKEA
jgi:hypothetical protein